MDVRALSTRVSASGTITSRSPIASYGCDHETSDERALLDASALPRPTHPGSHGAGHRAQERYKLPRGRERITAGGTKM
ncbi:hypothetical protein KBI5_17710 [Frankia sp. KB5]|nr:hypothetical protein KBI5_17710 [Frankia sp. KB5]